MADTISIDLSGVYSAINNAARTLNNNLQVINDNVNNVDSRLEATRRETKSELDKIKAELFEMKRQQKLAAALQRAITEVIRVRQEVEQKFGAHKQVRDYMLGILQATDLGLITKTTISKCTEELMISAPEYWLAPTLIALAAWISDNKPLAERAVKEAVKRDPEKAYLLFALVTRRVNAGRIADGKPGSNVSFLWLDRYFRLQDPREMKASIVAYVDAYSNGIFGEDKDNICEDHIKNWMKTLMNENPNFADEQKQYWMNFFGARTAKMTSSEFLALKKICPQYDLIDSYLGRIIASDAKTVNGKTGVKEYFVDIEKEKADKAKLVKKIDDQLMRLVTNYEEGEEAKLRDEEEYLQLVKEYQGDEEAAQRIMDAKAARRIDPPVDFAKRLSDSIADENADVSAKKTAIALLKGYISDAFKEFMDQKKETYPKEIDLAIKDEGKVDAGRSFTWKGKTENGENRNELTASLAKQYDSEKEHALSCISDEQAEKDKKTGIICCCLFFLVIPLFIGISKLSKSKKAKAANAGARERINAYYAKNKHDAVDTLNAALDARVSANQTVKDFEMKEDSDTLVLK